MHMYKFVIVQTFQSKESHGSKEGIYFPKNAKTREY